MENKTETHPLLWAMSDPGFECRLIGDKTLQNFSLLFANGKQAGIGSEDFF
jgi:hypothetical protein